MFLYLENVQDKVKEIKSKMKAEQIICLPIWNSMPFPLKHNVKQKSCRDNSLDEFLKKGQRKQFLKRYQPNMPAVIVYTSGTTGEPKGVLHTNDNLNADAVAKAMMKQKPEHMITGPAFISAIMKSCKGNMRWLKHQLVAVAQFLMKKKKS